MVGGEVQGKSWDWSARVGVRALPLSRAPVMPHMPLPIHPRLIQGPTHPLPTHPPTPTHPLPQVTTKGDQLRTLLQTSPTSFALPPLVTVTLVACLEPGEWDVGEGAIWQRCMCVRVAAAY